ncbi:MAG: hypothetical protein HZB51_17320 [Chloroflexi bacterium]|nr:hypothetical protein [Chloroflexota bacterium]
MIIQSLIKRGEYRDSVALMSMANKLAKLPGIVDVSVVMGTPANKSILQEAGLLNAEAQTASPNDLLIVVRADDATLAADALNQAEQMLSQRSITSSADRAARPQSLRSAIRSAPDANVAVISVPGQYAAAQAWDALRGGLNVLLFSDHVSVEDEIALKTYARDHGLLLMGPGAGTAILNGVGLGFANAVPRGNIGIVAAAGTGLQEVSTLIAKAGAGITQAIGVGGRDVSEAVGGIMLLEGLKALQADTDTRVIVVVSKLPSQVVAEKIFAQVNCSDKPTVLALMTNYKLQITNAQSPISNLQSLASDLREAAAMAVALSRGENVDTARKKLAAEDKLIERKARVLRRKLNSRASRKYLRGLYSGGTLCEETMRIWQESLGAVWSNAPLDPKFKLSFRAERRESVSNTENKISRRQRTPPRNDNANWGIFPSKQHTVIDLGEEEFTLGRPHPMIDNTLRAQRILQEARDSRVAAIVLDVVIGYGAHPDPASELAPAIIKAKQIAARKNRELIFIASVTGTESDPQKLSRQTNVLRKAGAMVMDSNAAAAKFASAMVR